MGCSYRDDLRRGSMREDEAKLRQAIALILEVAAGWSELIGCDGQFDNAADDGAFRERLHIAASLIESQLPQQAHPPEDQR